MKKFNTRPPKHEDLVTAWRKYFTYKQKLRLGVNNVQAKHVLNTFRHLRDTNKDVEGFGLSKKDLTQARQVLLGLPSDGVEEHVSLARELYQELVTRTASQVYQLKEHLRLLVSVLSRSGHTAEARSMFLDATKQESSLRESGETFNRHFSLLLNGFAAENNEADLLKTLELAEQFGAGFTPSFRAIVTAFYANRNDVEATKQWYARALGKEHNELFAKTYDEFLRAILQFGIRNQELGWTRTVFRDAINSNPGKKEWDVILQWAAGAMGKGVEDVEVMMKIMESKSTENVPTNPDSETINGLISIAMEHNDPYLAERYMELGRKFGISPDAGTFTQQIEYRVAKGDLSGAQSAYDQLQGQEILDNQDLPAINVYLRALCKAHDHTHITTIMSDLVERNARLEASTTGALAIMYMERDELHDAIDVLQANSWHYTKQERIDIRQGFTDFILDPKNDTARAWDAYTIMREVFNETSRDVRTTIMNEFFRRGRCDIACYTFGHMRQNIDARIRPVAETYIACLEGIAHLADAEQLDMVHNMLKMDSSIEPSTRLYNALMLAYAECDDADRAVDFWDDITNSAEGPTYNSLVILFRACELKPFAEKLAHQVWDKMKRMDIEITKEVFISYMAALSGRGQMDDVKRLVEGVQVEYGFKPDVDM